MPTALWAVRDALVPIFTTAVAPVVVFNGPAVKAPPKRFLLVGSDGGDSGMGDSDEDGAVIEQSVSSLGNTWRDERGVITCAAWAWSGDTKLDQVRTHVSDVLDAVETALRSDRTLGGVLAPPGRVEFGGIRIRERQTAEGAVIRAVFTVSYGALLIT